FPMDQFGGAGGRNGFVARRRWGLQRKGQNACASLDLQGSRGLLAQACPALDRGKLDVPGIPYFAVGHLEHNFAVAGAFQRRTKAGVAIGRVESGSDVLNKGGSLCQTISNGIDASAVLFFHPARIDPVGMQEPPPSVRWLKVNALQGTF